MWVPLRGMKSIEFVGEIGWNLLTNALTPASSITQPPALRSKMKTLATKACDPAVRKFVECSKQHNLSVVWKCRSLNREMNDCVRKHTTDEVLEDIKQQWLDSGRPSNTDWMPKLSIRNDS